MSATRHRMTSSALLLDPWPDPETRNRPEPVSVDFDHGPVDFDFDFLRWPLTKSQNFRKGLSCSVFHVDSNFGLRFFIWSSKIGEHSNSRHKWINYLYFINCQEFCNWIVTSSYKDVHGSGWEDFSTQPNSHKLGRVRLDSFLILFYCYYY